ncbi:Saccharopine dehydrogenase NADP-binding domain-containing protein [Sulfidibacter corallicola]|uniref:Saccharopine dehydrogenase NADP-binding domain-containing protein n=1 Tax=Sulfidibacter corallicola TaxID=2818388 RepID=A0A8A4TUS8_SULCO|nr:saccharopine dehydrogenase C-terminal domain-containing protein [Sulfidibacter corallicola]QTD53233.1 saccharopine dehydrogenase NADP-binding domain-containing protein [Sulfidibacter corallicola]
MKKVLVLGAGMVSRPLVDYLLDHGYALTLCDRIADAAEQVVAGRPHAEAFALDIAETDTIRSLVADHDLVVSLLPPALHTGVAQIALEAGKHFLTASYQSEAMTAMAPQVAERGLIFLNEVGLDPGLDHMTTMELIDACNAEGYAITSYESHCGGLPSRKAANNPLRYKFSWSPAGVLGALTRPSKYRRGGRLIELPGSEMLANAEVLHVPGVGVYESTPNADALYYGARYGIDEVPTLRRGTLRYPGWASFWRFMLSLDLVNRENKVDCEDEPALRVLFRSAGMDPETDIAQLIAERAPEQASRFLEAFDSLGLLNEDYRLTGAYSAFDVLLECALETHQYDDDEADLVVLHHEFHVEKDGVRELWTSSIIQEGIPAEKKTAMGLLVGIPTAIAARLILEDRITQKGVLIPVAREIYVPILEEMERLGFKHVVKRKRLS